MPKGRFWDTPRILQQVTVSAKALTLQTDNATTGQIVGEWTLSALPLNGRDCTTLIAINAVTS